MKKMTLLFSVIASMAVMLQGCSNKVLDSRNAEIVNGKIYKDGDNEPFTGKVTNLDGRTITGSRWGLYKAAGVMARLFLPARESEAAGNAISALGRLYIPDAVCDAHVNEGHLNGWVVCNLPNTDVRAFELYFDDGVLAGEFRYFGPKGGKHLAGTVSFVNGQADGQMEVFNLVNQNLVYRVEWKNGLLHGEEYAYDPNTKNVVGRATYVNDKIEGEIVRYAPDGKRVIYKATAVGGKKNGVEEIYSAETGTLMMRGNWIEGKQDGLFQEWDKQGVLVMETNWANGSKVVTPMPAVPAQENLGNAEACRDAWIVAYRQGGGEEAIVTVDQLGEWEEWCKQGKYPN